MRFQHDSGVCCGCAGFWRGHHSNQLLRTAKGLQWINKPDPSSPTHTCVQTPSTDTDPQQPPDRALLAGAATSFVPVEAGEAHLPTQGCGDRATACYCSREHLFVVPNPKRASLPACGREFTHSWNTQPLPSSQDLRFPCLLLYLLLCKQSVEGKETTHIATQKAKQARFGKGK